MKHLANRTVVGEAEAHGSNRQEDQNGRVSSVFFLPAVSSFVTEAAVETKTTSSRIISRSLSATTWPVALLRSNLQKRSSVPSTGDEARGDENTADEGST